MKNNKKKETFIFIVVFSLLLCILGYRHFSKEKLGSDKIYAYRNAKDNLAETIIVNGPANLVAGESELKPGFYDISAEMVVDTNAFYVDENYQQLNKVFYKTNGFYLPEGTTVKLTRSTFKPFVFKDDVVVLENVMGEFEVGKEIPSGDYTFQVKKESDEALVYISTKKLKAKNDSESHQFKGDEIVKFHLKDGQYLQINNLFPEYGKFTVIVKKIS